MLLVTGAGGFLGTYFVRRACARGLEVVAVDRDDFDINDAAATTRAIAAARPDVVVHLAALCGAQPSVEQPAEFLRTNAQGTVHVLEACRTSGVTRFVFASSLTVFGSCGEQGVTEQSPFAPRHPYAAAKAGAEHAVRIYAARYGMRAVIVRPTLVVGEGCREPHAIGDFTRSAQADGTIDLFGGGGHVRDFVHPLDVAAAFEAVVERTGQVPGGTCESFNIANGEPLSMRELAQRALRIVGRGRIAVTPATNQSFSLFTQTDHAGAVLGWRPTIGVDEIIARLAS